MLTKPCCPECGTPCEHHPIVVRGSCDSAAEVETLVRHDHEGCEVYRYRALIRADGSQVAEALPHGVWFEDRALEAPLGDAA